jgi:hypothetical protein
VRVIIFILPLLLCATRICAQESPQAVIERVDTTATNNRKWKEITNVCNALDIPANPKANLSLLIFTLDWHGTPYCFGGSSKNVQTALVLPAMPIKKYIPKPYQECLVLFMPIVCL